ncbi:MAG TPA: hypothetical protein VK988_21285 [Acidimicrobiales bacterium]|nr:hypothetical protein [Acidimicrobiales bacterium]
MAKTLNVRDLPDELHQILAARAARRGASLRQYTIEVLAAHCSLPTMEEWLGEVEALTPAEGDASGAEAVERAREDDDAEVVLARRGG